MCPPHRLSDDSEPITEAVRLLAGPGWRGNTCPRGLRASSLSLPGAHPQDPTPRPEKQQEGPAGTIGRAVPDGMSQPRGEGLGVGPPLGQERASPLLRGRHGVVVHLGTRQRRACGTVTFAPAESPPPAPLLSPLVTLPAPVLGGDRPQEFRPHASHHPALPAEDGSTVAVTSTTVSRRMPPGVWTWTWSPRLRPSSARPRASRGRRTRGERRPSPL
jgi:hypothetical protein